MEEAFAATINNTATDRWIDDPSISCITTKRETYNMNNNFLISRNFMAMTPSYVSDAKSNVSNIIASLDSNKFTVSPLTKLSIIIGNLIDHCNTMDELGYLLSKWHECPIKHSQYASGFKPSEPIVISIKGDCLVKDITIHYEGLVVEFSERELLRMKGLTVEETVECLSKGS